MATTLVTAPTSYPVTLDEVKDHLRVIGNDLDDQLTSLIAEGTQFVERQTGRRLITQTWKLVLDGFYIQIKIPNPPLQSISSITYLDGAGNSQTLGASNYTVDTDSEPGRVRRSPDGTYPSTYNDLNAVTITFVCGYGDKTSVPEELKAAIKLYIERRFDNPSGPYADALDSAMMSLILSYRIDGIDL